MNDRWHLSAASVELDEDGNPKPGGKPNVLGRFSDHKAIDGPASRAAGKATYKLVILLQTRIKIGLMEGQPSADVSSHLIRFKTYPGEAAELLRRHSDAWRAYQEYRQTPEMPGEAEIVAEVFGEDAPKPKAKRVRKEKPAANVVELKTAGAA